MRHAHSYLQDQSSTEDVRDAKLCHHTGNGRLVEGEVDQEENGEAAVAVTATAVATAAGVMARTVPTRYRWISTLGPSPDARPGDKMFLSFYDPVLLLLYQSATPDVDADGDIKLKMTQEQEQK